MSNRFTLSHPSKEGEFANQRMRNPIKYDDCFYYRKRDCLHRFVVVLCERGKRLELVEYPYVNLLQEVGFLSVLNWFSSGGGGVTLATFDAVH